MKLENIKLDFTKLPHKHFSIVKKSLNNFELKGGANFPTSMFVTLPDENKTNWIELSPVEERKGEKDLRFQFELQSLPSSCFVGYFFGGSNSPASILIQRLSSLNGQQSYVEESFRIYSNPLDKI